MKKKYLMAIDRGQTGIKVSISSEKAQLLKVVSKKCQEIQSPHPGWAQQDMNLIWSYTVDAIRQVIKDADISAEEIGAISFSGQGGGNFLVDKEGNPVREGALSLDSRHEEIMDLIKEESGKMAPRTILFMRWLKEKEPENYKKTRWILGSKDWIRFKLSGVASADMSDGPAPLDLIKGCYRTTCCEDAGVKEIEDMLPPLKYASEISGYVTEKAAKECGLLAGTPVVTGAHDMIACSIGAGGMKQGHLTIIMGTLGINIAVVDEKTKLPTKDSHGKWFQFGGIKKGLRTCTSSIGSGCSAMDYFLNLFFVEEQKAAKEKGISIFEYLESMLEGQEPSPVIFQPYLMGTFYNSDAKASLMGITSHTTKAEILMGLFQGIGISMCMEIKRLEEMLGCFQDIWLVGGGSNSNIWGQMFADVLEREVQIPQTSEVGCRGASICAGIALDLFEDLSDITPEARKIYIPNAGRKDFYKEQLSLYKEAYRTNEKLWKH